MQGRERCRRNRFEPWQCRVARGSESRFGDVWGPVGWNPEQTAPKRGSVWYILAVRNAKKEILVKMGMSWRAIIAALGTAAELVRSAKNLRETVSDLGDRREAPSPPPAEQGNQSAVALAELHARMERVEASEAKQAELIAKMADQDQALWNQLQHLAARVDKIFWIALVALIFSSVLILRELIRLFF